MKISSQFDNIRYKFDKEFDIGLTSECEYDERSREIKKNSEKGDEL